ncbi:MAG TPA: XRE family transcriptional regulator [Erysipelotrichaceae bacterium]|nr:XRE family transcriptional regulator [Erysipelotrichaceae bacterium]
MKKKFTVEYQQVLVGMRIRELRKNQGMSQEALALRSGVDRTYITTLEAGTRNMSIVSISKVCHGLNLSLEEFFTSPLFGQLIQDDTEE